MVRIPTISRDENPRATSFGGLLIWSGVELRDDVILPEQFVFPTRIQHKHRGKVALLYAILSDAITCFLEERREEPQNRSRAAREAEAWLFVDDYSWPFSFVNICELLDLDPTYLRRGLERSAFLDKSVRSIKPHENRTSSVQFVTRSLALRR